jgi:hypothetical protein
MPVQTRNMKKKVTFSDQSAAYALMTLNTDYHEPVYEPVITDSVKLDKMKTEISSLKLIKEYTANYNTLKMLVDVHTIEMDRLEIKITTLLSTI